VKKATFLLISIIFLFASGCATVSKMPLQSASIDMNTSEKSLLLAKVKIKNNNVPSHQPDLVCIFVDIKGEVISYTEPTLTKDLKNDGKEYLVSLDMRPGKATINAIRFSKGSALAEIPFKQDIEVPQNKIIYIGNIAAIITSKDNDNEPSAGPSIPLITQALAGFSTGKFVVVVADQYDDDVSEFRKQYPYLSGKEIIKMVLPPWVHP
jgi:hypothetical protein